MNCKYYGFLYDRLLKLLKAFPCCVSLCFVWIFNGAINNDGSTALHGTNNNGHFEIDIEIFIC